MVKQDLKCTQLIWAAEGLRKEDSLEVKVRALLSERRQRIGYERELEAAVLSCQ